MRSLLRVSYGLKRYKNGNIHIRGLEGDMMDVLRAAYIGSFQDPHSEDLRKKILIIAEEIVDYYRTWAPDAAQVEFLNELLNYQPE